MSAASSAVTVLKDRPFALHVIAALLAGAVGAFGQAPYAQPIALVIGCAMAFALWRVQATPMRAGVIGWAFGTGYFAHALIWITEPFQVDAARHAWMAPFALVFLSAGLALFWATAFWLARRISLSAGVVVIIWAGAELLRAYVLTGFPWASPAQILVDGPASRLLAVVGPHGATFCLLALAWMLSLSAGDGRRGSLRLGQSALLGSALLALYLPLAVPAAPITAHTVRLIQPNAEQHLKWQPDHAETFFRRQLDLTAAPAADPAVRPDLIVWPETAIPWRLGAAGPAFAAMSDASNGAPIALGVLRFEGQGLRNALVVLDAAGTPQAIYDKHHLVPFGEYIPFAWLAEKLGLQGLVVQGTGFAPGPGPSLIDFGPLGRAMPLICYEAVFAHEVNAAPERPQFLLHVTNDAWFGTHAGPQQHLAQARMRAIEQGLPVARSANTGISAMIDPYGRLTAQLPLGEANFIDAALPAPLPATLYSRIGDRPVAALLLIALAVVFLRQMTGRSRQSD